MNAKDIFLQAIEIDSLEDRRAFVDRACNQDEQLRRRVSALIGAHDDPDSHLERPAAKFDVTQSFDGENHSSSWSDSSSHHGRFLPGTKVADRYRIVSLLGRGGMGEVYRADDLRLGQAVALKFLPEELAKDEKRLTYFHNEVKLARQISHPNVCRVYDIGEVDGQHFISMEYIDGEDLKTLLRRIGRLPHDKGVEIAHQLCVGMAAAHAQGVLHRDLKPANIMVDGNGRVRITDFGLATGDAEGANVVGMSGTPAYMAPEQFLRGETSIQSDVYSIGLILFELFTGQAAHEASSVVELRELHEASSSPTDPSDLVGDLDSAVRIAIQRCLSPDPAERPSGMNVLAGSLPGGDPLAAALAAGETPSPEIVAASGAAGGLSMRTAALCLLGVTGGLAAVCFYSTASFAVNRANLEKSPEVLAHEAREILDSFGYGRGVDSIKGFSGLDTSQAGRLPVRFWYRESPDALVHYPHFESVGGNRPGISNPPWDRRGMCGVQLSTKGELRWFRAMPKQVTDAGAATSEEPDWYALFPPKMTGFDLSKMQPASPRRPPPDAFEHYQAWEGVWLGSDSDRKLYVAAASYSGRPTYFEVDSHPGLRSTPWGKFVLYFFMAVMTGALICMTVLVWRNWRLRRGDRSGALRYSFFVAIVAFVSWVLKANHVADWREHDLIANALSGASSMGVLTWICYMALEPLTRRHWPELLISWTRLLDGRFRDARVGRDLLVGVLFQVWISAYELFGRSADPKGVETSSEMLMGFRSALGYILEHSIFPLSADLVFVAILVCLYVLSRSKLLAILGLATIFTIFISGFFTPELTVFFFLFPSFLAASILLGRFGLLAFVSSRIVFTLLRMPITTDASAFYFEVGMAAILTTFAIALWGAYLAVGGQRKLLPTNPGRIGPI